MKISFNWIKQYIDTDLSVEEVSRILTDTGLEVEKVEKIETVKGGLEGLVIGKVLSKEKHPDADRLNVTNVSVGGEEPLQIVCGAPNVEAGQKVVVATNGTTIFPTNGESFKIKKSKIRGIESNGMICAEDEIGLGASHDGIMVLDAQAKVGVKAKDFFNIEDDYLLEIGLTPNRADAMGHVGVARDLLAALKYNGVKDDQVELNLPRVDAFSTDVSKKGATVEIKDLDACPRYSGITIKNVEVKDSPDWLKNNLRAIGLTPKNNVVDATNFVLHELGQPLHAFDLDKIEEERVVVRKANANEKFVTLDEVERTLNENDLLICDSQKPMCIAGVFGGVDSGVTENTKNIFIESAYFNPVSVRKTAKKHGLNTDASFRFERGVDPNLTVFTLKRVALLIQEIAGGECVGDIIDIYPNKIEDFKVSLKLSQLNKVAGVNIEEDKVVAILESLDIKMLHSKGGELDLLVPAYRVDVQREIDVIEEVMRIYGFNNIPVPTKINASISYFDKLSADNVQNVVSNALVSNGFLEGMSNSLTSSKYSEKYLNPDHNVSILNALSSDLNVMRQSVMFNVLEAVAYNQNHQTSDIKLFEFGNVYHKFSEGYNENKRLAIALCGQKNIERWNSSNASVSYYTIKGTIEMLLNRLGINKNKSVKPIKSDVLLEDGEQIVIAKKTVANLGWIKKDILKDFSIKQNVFVADINWDVVMDLMKMNKTKFKPISKFPSVRRDFSLLLDNDISFSQLKEIAKKCDNKLLKEIDLFDVYEGKNLPEGKKSYAISYIFKDDNKTLTDKTIDKIMNKIQASYQSQLNAELR